MSLSTPIQVRQRLSLDNWEGNDKAITQFITDAEAILASFAGHEFTAADSDYKLAVSICTNLAAEQLLIALINPPDSKPDPQKTAYYLKSLPYLRNIIERDLSYLVKRERLPEKESPLPRNTIR